MFVMNYLSLGCGRSTEVKDAPPFSTVKFIFNRIVHQMRSNKGEAHGQVRNEHVPHYMSPSLSRRFILVNVCLKPAIEQSDSVSFPPRTDLAMTGMFRRVVNLQNDLSVRNCRQAMASIHNFMSPAGMSRITIESGMARAFHHTPGVHEASYSAEEMTRLPDGQLAMSDLIAARRIERAMGEPIESFPEAEQNQQGASMSLGLLNAAARHLYGPTATLRCGANLCPKGRARCGEELFTLPKCCRVSRLSARMHATPKCELPKCYVECRVEGVQFVRFDVATNT